MTKPTEKAKEECLSKLYSLFIDPNSKFSTCRLGNSVSDYAQPEKWNPNM